MFHSELERCLFLGVFTPEKEDKSLRVKVSYALRQIDVQRKDLEQLRFRLEERRKRMFDMAVRAIEKNDEMRARVLAGEHLELQKITRVVNASELALLHINVRLETIRDVGDIMYVLSNAFKEVRKIGKSVSEVAPNLERAAAEINDSLSNILAELRIVSPNIELALTDSPSEIFEKARRLISERTSELSEIPKSIEHPNIHGSSIFEKTKNVALLATEDDEEEDFDSEEFKPILYSSLDDPPSAPEDALRNYIKTAGASKINIVDASARLNLPVDLVEQAYIKVLADQRFSADSSRVVKQAPNAAGN
jgi:division protein CdvB (Snf7/Vps24/ESCRT-III family)